MASRDQKAGKVDGRLRRGGWRFKFSALLEGLLLTRMLANDGHLPDVLVRAVHYALGPGAAASLQADIAGRRLHVPSPSTLSRGRLKFDVLSMLVRQAEFKSEGPYFIFLSSDSSPQGGLDFMMSLEDKVSRCAAARLVDCGDNMEMLEEWCRSSPITTTQLPLSIIGSGNAGLPSKSEALAHSDACLCPTCASRGLT